MYAIIIIIIIIVIIIKANVQLRPTYNSNPITSLPSLTFLVPPQIS
jgi:TRAP-type C4-dicarboxylate transport system permease small subunit